MGAKRRYLITAAVSAALMLGTVAAVPAVAQTKGANTNASPCAGSNKKATSFLWTFGGKNVRLKPSATRSREFTLIMPVQGKSNTVTWFTDRPQRVAGQISIGSFVDMWDKTSGPNSFKEDPPNVAISTTGGTLVAKMNEPRIIDSEDVGSVMKVSLRLLKNQELSQLSKNKNLAYHVSRAGDNKLNSSQLKFDRIMVFVDGSGCVNCWSPEYPNCVGCETQCCTQGEAGGCYNGLDQECTCWECGGIWPTPNTTTPGGNCDCTTNYS